ncbi:MAG: hypothetical protein AB8G15_17545 [Saprospiraceae bacterium]
MKYNKMRAIVSVIILFTIWSACQQTNTNTAKKEAQPNEVLVLGTIHSGHLREASYNLEVLTTLIQAINPDVILTEIPPDRFPIAAKEFAEKDTITEPRVKRFPEYVDVIFPLSKTMDFEIIPTAGWTKEMADQRRDQLAAIQKDSSRATEWAALTRAGQLSDSLLTASGRSSDPYWINSDAYDELVEIELSVYNELFNEELGLGGWDNINEAHYHYIAKALDEYTGQGKRMLITYGAGHKGWFLRALKKRTDIQLISLAEAVKSKRQLEK